MPRLSDTMEDGTIVAWLKGDGDEVRPGDDLVEIETDKATMSCQAETAGTLRIVVPEGGVAVVGATIATIGDRAGEDDAAGGGAADGGASATAAGKGAANGEAAAAGDGAATAGADAA